MCAADLRLRTWDTAAHAAAETPLHFTDGSATVALRCLPGGSGIHVVVASDAGVQLRAEIAAEPGETVPIRVEVDERGTPHLTSRARDVIQLPRDSRYDPPAPIRPAPASAPVDVAIVVDGTTRNWPATSASEKDPAQKTPLRLLDRKDDLWAAHVEKLVAFVAGIARGREARVAVIAFGDQSPPAVTALDLQPRYHLHPAEDERVLRPLDDALLRERLLGLPSTPGADFVDATADALEACAQLRWDRSARKIVLLTGDSPGASVLHPLPKGADLSVRRFDVDTRVVALHSLGVELVTIYHPPASTLGLHGIAPQRDLLLSAREQYERLASQRELAFVEESFEPEVAAERLRKVAVIARGAALGERVAATKP